MKAQHLKKLGLPVLTCGKHGCRVPQKPARSSGERAQSFAFGNVKEGTARCKAWTTCAALLNASSWPLSHRSERLSQGEVGGRCVSAGGMHRTSPGGSFCHFAPRGDGRIAPAGEFCGDRVLN